MGGGKGRERETGLDGGKDTWGGGKGRKAESWPDSKPVERHALGKEKQTKRGMDSRRLEKSSLRFEAGADRPTAVYIDIHVYIYASTRPRRACCILCAEYFRL